MSGKFLLLVALVLLGAGCAKTISTPTDDGGAAKHKGVPVGTNEHTPAKNDGAILAGERVALENSNVMKPGQVSLVFSLYGTDGAKLTDADLKTEHEKKMHFLLVRDDMTQFQHIHPEYSQGKWRIATMIAEAGDYQLYVDIAPEKEAPVVLRLPVTIGGPTVNPQFPVPALQNTATVNAIKAQLTANKSLGRGEEITLTFTLTKNGQSVKQIDPYLGAYGHVVLLKHGNPDDFYHVHPITKTKPANGAVLFAATFPTSGRYTLYAQFQIDGMVNTFPITVDIP